MCNTHTAFSFQMSDVKRGGATVFPKLNFALEARKGSAAFWYNLHSSGNLDYSTLHGACPVLIGEKWGKERWAVTIQEILPVICFSVANKWIRERGQEFRRKCDPDDMEWFIIKSDILNTLMESSFAIHIHGNLLLVKNIKLISYPSPL